MAESNVVNLGSAAATLRAEFIAWQCRLRRHAMREAGGRPSPGMRPAALDASDRPIAEAVTVLLARHDSAAVARLLEFQFKRTHDPLDRYEKAVTFLSAEYYQRPGNFTGVLTALFGGGTNMLPRLLESRRCVLAFHQFTHGFRLPCDVALQSPEDPLFQFTYWHNALFNPNLPPDAVVVGFTPDWVYASRFREASPRE